MKKLEKMKKDKDIKAMYKIYKVKFKGKDSFNLYVNITAIVQLLAVL